MEDAVGLLRAFIMPFVVVLGLLGNVTTMAIFVLENSGRKWTRFAMYGFAIAVSDTLALVFNTFLDDFLGRGLLYASSGTFLIKIDTASSLTCKLMEYIPSVAYFTSSYLLVMFSLDRILSIFQPLKFMSNLHTKATLTLILVIFAAGLFLMAPMAVIHDISLQNNTSLDKKCKLQSNSRMYDALSKVMLYFMTFGSFVAPAVIVCLLSAVIVTKLTQIRRNRASLLPTAADNQMEMSRFYAHLSLAITYCVLVLPLAVAICLRQLFEHKPDDYRRQNRDYQQLLIHGSRFASSVKDFNYALNFWVYLLFVRSFRRRSLIVVSHLLVTLHCSSWCKCCRCCRSAEDRVHKLRARNHKSVRQGLYRHCSRLLPNETHSAHHHQQQQRDKDETCVTYTEYTVTTV